MCGMFAQLKYKKAIPQIKTGEIIKSPLIK
jgi:hypothetical protein